MSFSKDIKAFLYNLLVGLIPSIFISTFIPDKIREVFSVDTCEAQVIFQILIFALPILVILLAHGVIKPLKEHRYLFWVSFGYVGLMLVLALVHVFVHDASMIYWIMGTMIIGYLAVGLLVISYLSHLFSVKAVPAPKEYRTHTLEFIGLTIPVLLVAVFYIGKTEKKTADVFKEVSNMDSVSALYHERDLVLDTLANDALNRPTDSQKEYRHGLKQRWSSLRNYRDSLGLSLMFGFGLTMLWFWYAYRIIDFPIHEAHKENKEKLERHEPLEQGGFRVIPAEPYTHLAWLRFSYHMLIFIAVLLAPIFAASNQPKSLERDSYTYNITNNYTTEKALPALDGNPVDGGNITFSNPSDSSQEGLSKQTIIEYYRVDSINTIEKYDTVYIINPVDLSNLIEASKRIEVDTDSLRYLHNALGNHETHLVKVDSNLLRLFNAFFKQFPKSRDNTTLPQK